MRICSTRPAGPSKDGPIDQPMNRGPNTIRKRPAISVSDIAILDHLRNTWRSSAPRPSMFSFVAIGITTAAIAMTNSIR